MSSEKCSAEAYRPLRFLAHRHQDDGVEITAQQAAPHCGTERIWTVGLAKRTRPSSGSFRQMAYHQFPIAEWLF